MDEPIEQVTYPDGVTAAEVIADLIGGQLDAERLSAVMEGRNDSGYNPPDYPLIVDDDPADPDVKADH